MEKSQYFPAIIGLRLGCAASIIAQCLIRMMWEAKARANVEQDLRLVYRGQGKWEISVLLFAGDATLVAYCFEN